MKVKRIIAVSLTMILILLGAAACSNHKLQRSIDNFGELIEFQYSFGGYNEGYWYYKIYEKDGKTYLLGEGGNGVELEGKSEVPGHVLDDIASIIKEYNIAEWDGFREDAGADVLDGYSFEIDAVYENGRIEAGGYEMYPPNYDAGHEALYSYLDELSKEAGLN